MNVQVKENKGGSYMSKMLPSDVSILMYGFC